jgi:transposase InsO family protein
MGVSRSAYYDWQKGVSHTLNVRKAMLSRQVKEVFEYHKGRYGSRRIEAELKAKGERIGRYQIRKRMQEQDLRAIQPRSFVPKTTQTNPHLRRSPNLLLEMEAVDMPNKIWVGDITYLPLRSGSWAYLSTWMDLYSRKIVGFRVCQNMEASIVLESLRKAVQQRCPAPGLVIHSDGGGQYMEKTVRNFIKDNHFNQSMTRVDNHYDNAFAESFFSRFKAELLGRKGVFEDFTDAKQKTFEFIESYYNRERRHSSLGYESPSSFEEKLLECQVH